MSNFKIISLYTGAGGLDYGFEAAGFETAIALDFDEDSCKTISASRSLPVIHDDIHEVSTEKILEAGNLNPGEASVLIGGPPCQPFSKSSYWVNGDTGRLKDPRARTLEAFMRVVKEALPEVFLFENVHGITYSGKEEGFKYLLKMTEKINRSASVNYTLSWDVLNAADFGVPQKRRRFFLIGHREGYKFSFPEPTHFEYTSQYEQLDLIKPQRYPITTAWDAIWDIKPSQDEDLEVKGQWADLLPSIPEGENYLWHTNRKRGLPLFGWRTRYWSFLLKLAKQLPSWTIQANPGPSIGPFHWGSRLLSVREIARLQTFPDDVKFIGSRRSIQRQLGNAVPSLLAEVLAREIGSQFFSVSYQSPPKLLLKPKRPIPSPEPTSPVPEKYLRLVGDHPDHPGEGKGNGALQSQLTN